MPRAALTPAALKPVVVFATRQKMPDDGFEPIATLALLAQSRAASGRGAAISGTLYRTLCWPNPQEIKALRWWQFNRRAVGAARRCAAACGLDSARVHAPNGRSVRRADPWPPLSETSVRCGTLVAVCALMAIASCAPLPDVFGAERAEVRGAFPELLPLSGILAQADEAPRADADTDGALSARAGALQARAVALRGPVLTTQERERLQRSGAAEVLP